MKNVAEYRALIKQGLHLKAGRLLMRGVHPVCEGLMSTAPEVLFCEARS
jgi:hypothetical protein